MIVTLPWPHRDLSPNARVHWRVLAKAKRKAKSDAFFLAIEAGVRIHPKVTTANVAITFRPPDMRRRDADNCIASIKSQIDGVACALGIDDSRWTLTLNPMGEPVERGAVVLEISE